MDEKKHSIREQLENYDAGKYKYNSIDVAVQAGWFDWFCKDSSLYNRTHTLYPFLKRIVKSPKIDQDKCYFFFKNNCPTDGSLYDSISICDIETGDVLYWMTLALGYNNEDKGKAELDKIEKNNVVKLLVGKPKDIVAWFMSNES